jgi:5-methyltetrahydropteroyltriglutamate--homocysteine methyltransferase
VDEPALREGLPLKTEQWQSYLEWAVDAFRLTCAVAAPETQIVTHLCYSQFEDILPAIDRLDGALLQTMHKLVFCVCMNCMQHRLENLSLR